MDRTFCIAPMMDRTDRHCRYFHRVLTKKSHLYTEMIHSNAIINGDTDTLLAFNPKEHPLALQLGGSDPYILAEASEISKAFGYKEINLNVGCPSSKVQKGKFGAVLMKEPKLVAECVKKMKNTVNIPITVKCRIGVDDMDEHKHLDSFISKVYDAGCETFIIHARKAWLKGLSPKENREVPPLNYERVYKLKETFPAINLVINGGIKSIDESLSHLQHVDGVMIGREAYENPLLLEKVDHRIFHEEYIPLTRKDILKIFYPYIKSEVESGTKLNLITRHLMGLFKGFDGAKNIRKLIISLNKEINPIENFKVMLEEKIA